MRLAAWHRADWLDASGVLTIVLLLHVAAFGLLIGVDVPLHHRVGDGVFGVGLGLTAYTYGLRHAFDADHIAAIDNTTRRLRGDGGRATSVGFWFAMGHSTIVGVLAALVASGAGLAATLTGGRSSVDHVLGLVSRSLSGGFLYLIGVLNLVALARVARMLRRVGTGALSEQELEAGLTAAGLVTRLLARLNRTVTRPWQMYLVGLLFGLGFDTATEVSLLVLAGSGAAQRLPWIAVMTLPLLFAAGMSLLDSLDGMFMSVAYDWAFLNPVRKIYYNLSITGLSVAVALVIGSIEFVAVLHDQGGWRNPVSDWISGIRMNEVGFIIAGLFAVTWALAVVSWRLLRVEERWTANQLSDVDGSG
ncbi:HoxN/HupN/NixA family nickel/cobalt transporter [Aestuariimicrobium kwangyangense]|uniref:HoxN/HupN/NixA family nickel/cobalt transporter n=1 Tax=Aestuariimicrobium kwangyangense TaxID=396389 RepID=UPI0003B3DEB9|nr:HoxN/HupN/NixA family nickel/cobalt transporter [Aestuariimicrobium kwangyangense]